jgi:hypothetical protein
MLEFLKLAKFGENDEFIFLSDNNINISLLTALIDIIN